MEKELSRIKIVIGIVVGIIFIVMVALFIAATASKKMGTAPDRRSDTASETQKTAKEEGAGVEDRIDFEDPGNDETGQSVKELDALINDISPSELSGDDLSEGLIEGDFELE